MHIQEEKIMYVVNNNYYFSNKMLRDRFNLKKHKINYLLNKHGIEHILYKNERLYSYDEIQRLLNTI